MEEKKNSNERSEPRGARAKGNALQMSEDEASRLVGGIVEKGISDAQQNKLFDSVAPPKPSVLPFPVARHRSHGPHWESVTSKKGGDSSKDNKLEDVEDDESFMEIDSIANFANPIQRKEKNRLDFDKWREVGEGHNHVAANKEGRKDLGLPVKTSDNTMTSCNPSSVNVLDASVTNVDHRLSDFPNKPTEMSMRKSDSGQGRPMNGVGLEGLDQQHIWDRKSLLDVHDGSRYIAESVLNNEQGRPLDDSSLPEKVPYCGSNIFKAEDVSTSLESQIDEENRARIQGMSPDEIAEAQAEIKEKLNPALLKALRRRGQEKFKKGSSNSSLGEIYESADLQKENTSNKIVSPCFENGISSVKTSDITSKDTTSVLQNVAVQKSDSGSSAWDDWNDKVEAVRSLRFSLEGNVVDNCFLQEPVNVHGYSIENVTSRDFLRTEGDPSAAGYTIKEAVALTRSVIPGQRVIGLRVISNVLGKALHSMHQKKVGSTMAECESSIDYSAIWAFALGPEPELALSLRMCLDDNHNSVVLACAEAIQCTFCCDLNEAFFDTLERTSNYEKDCCTAPVFRSKPDIDLGFLQGGFWKYSAKPSNVVPFSEYIENDEAGEKYTIQDDIVVSGQDFVAGLVRMGILHRLRYLLEADPSAALEECILSILVAIARHSPTCARAIMKCERLVESIIHRFTMSSKVDAHSSKIKSVILLKVLARSDKKNSIAFVKSGTFRTMTWNLYQYTSSIDHWVRLGKEKCKLSSALIVEQLRFWKVCIQYGYCVSYFSDVFAALCLWLNPPNFKKLMENNVLSEFTTICIEVYHVLEALARRLPNFFSQEDLDSEKPGHASNDSEIWSWSCVVPMIDLAMKWIKSKSDPLISKCFESLKEETKDGLVLKNVSLTSLLWVYSAVMKMLSQVFERIVPQDCIAMEGRCQIVPWLPEFVPQVGLEIIKNGFLSFAGAYDTEHKIHPSGGSSFVEDLCHWREHGEFEASLASICCLHGLMKTVANIDRLIQLARTENLGHPSKDLTDSREGTILMNGMFRESLMEQRSVVELFTKVIALECDSLQFIETFGRGGPAPGVGIGWGVSGGGYWSPAVSLAQNDAAFLISHIEGFQNLSNLDIPADRELVMHSINSAFAACLLLGPRDAVLVERALKLLLQAPILHGFNFYIQSFFQQYGKVKRLSLVYGEEDCLILNKILSSHYKDRWLSPKESKSTKNKSNNDGRTFENSSVSLDTIYEESDETNRIGQDCTSLIVQWPQQRLPLPRHWVFSPIATICDSKYVGRQKSSDKRRSMHDSSDLFEVAKSGLFFILGVEAFSTFLPNGLPSPIQSVPLIWKLHSLSVVLLVGMGVLDDEKSRDVYEVLQDLYGQRLNEARFSRLSEPNPKNDAKYSLLPQPGNRKNLEFLMFRSEVHDNYTAFIETLVEQFSAVSFGDVLYGRQIVLYLHRCVEAPIRLATWNALTNARVLELLPTLGNCFADADGYLQPIEDNESILEAYVKSWVSGAIDRAASRGSMAFLLVLHHLSSYIFHSHPSANLLLRNKLSRSLLRDYSQKQQHKGMMLDLILYTEPSIHLTVGQKGAGSSIEMSTVEKRLEVLQEVCERNSSLLTVVEELGSSVKQRLSEIHVNQQNV